MSFRSSSRFTALPVDPGQSSDEDGRIAEPEEVPPPLSKKAAARRRAAERKKQDSTTPTQAHSPAESPARLPSPPPPAIPKYEPEPHLPQLEAQVPKVEEPSVEAPGVEEPDAGPVQQVIESTQVSDVEEPAKVQEKSVQPQAYTGADHEQGKKLRSFITRLIYSLVMILSLIAIVCMGHVYIIMLVFALQAIVFAELTTLFDAGYSPRDAELTDGNTEERDRWSKRTAWYFFAVTNYFLYGESLIYYFKHILAVKAEFLPATLSFAQHHRLISFILYIIGFVSFVANLDRSHLRRQFGLFGWIHISLMLMVVSSHFIVDNILEGLIWFWQPVSLVVMNDIAAYVCGMLFGKNMLIKLSPKKTVEGFVGAFFITIVFAVVWGSFFMRFSYFICPVEDLATNVFTDIQCVPNHVFVWREFALPSSIQSVLSSFLGLNITSIPWAPFQFHSVVMAIFASLVAPFGGFFASGFKRAFNIKDFGDSIPGHGGMTDRMDCQFLMGLFSYVYYASLIRETHVTVSSIMGTVLTSLDFEQQKQLASELAKIIAAQEVQNKLW